MFTSQGTWNCRSCGHKHTKEQWESTVEPKYCHACGSAAVTPSNDPHYDWQAALATTSGHETEEHDDTPDEATDEAPVEVPETIQVDEVGTEVEVAREVKAAPKPKIKPKRKR